VSQGKLVRDKIPEIIRGEGLEPVIYAADEQEYVSRLRDKLQEEVGEFIASDNDLEELADILEGVYALAEQAGTNREQLEKLRAAKADKRDRAQVRQDDHYLPGCGPVVRRRAPAPRGGTDWADVRARHVQQLLASYVDTSAGNQFRALQQFFRWHATEDLDELRPNPMAGLKPPRSARSWSRSLLMTNWKRCWPRARAAGSRTAATARSSRCRLDGTGRDDPACRLLGVAGDCVEVPVVVEDLQAADAGGRCDDEARDRG